MTCLLSVRILGLDVGSKTIGIAVTDDLGLCAHAVNTLQRRGTKIDAQKILEYCAQFQTKRIVIGLPTDIDGNEGKRAFRVRLFGNALEQLGLSVLYQDESFSTVDAEQILLAADLSRKKRKKVIDRLAAAVILQSWLEKSSLNKP